MIDVHCHLADKRYQGTGIQRIVDEAREAGVGVIVNGTGTTENRKHLETAEKNDGVWVCVGVAYEPGYENQDKIREELRKMCRHPKVVGIGEAGLNYYSGMSDELRQYQLKLFEMHLELAAETGLPIEIHNREADEEIHRILSTKYEVLRGKTLLHCFSGTVEFMKQMEDLGCYFSFGGMTTYKKNGWIREVVKLVRADRLLVETDAPYLPPEPLRGTINTPANVKIIAEKIAEIRGVTAAGLEKLVTENTRRLFKLT